MQDYLGNPFYPLDPKAEEVDICHIAHALSMNCRYNGACAEFYSVAEHCWYVSYYVKPEYAIFGLLHDAAEAYMSDLVRPIKQEILRFKEIEINIQQVIWSHFSLESNPEIETNVKEIDNRILVDERIQNMANSRLPWKSVEDLKPLGIKLNLWYPKLAEKYFMSRFNQLTNYIWRKNG